MVVAYDVLDERQPIEHGDVRIANEQGALVRPKAGSNGSITVFERYVIVDPKIQVFRHAAAHLAAKVSTLVVGKPIAKLKKNVEEFVTTKKKKRRGRGSSTQLKEVFHRATAEAEVAFAVNLDLDDYVASKKDVRTTELYRIDVLTMSALRWSNDIVCEKCCILVGSWTSLVLMDSYRSPTIQFMLTAIFFAAEFASDGLVEWSLEKFFGVPFSRLPRVREEKSNTDYWMSIFVLVNVFVAGSFMFDHAFATADEWFHAAGANETALNATSTIAMEEGLVN
jgi:hypothetical protein